MEKKYVINIRYVFLIITIYLFVFQNLLQTYIPYFQYYDEFVAIVSVPIIFFNLINKKSKNKQNKKIMIFLVLILIIGVLGNIIYKYQIIKYVLFDMLLFLKFYLIYFMSEIVWNNSFLEKYNKKIRFHIGLIALILCFFTFLNYAFTIWPNDYRYGILSNKLFYSHPTFLSGICIFLLSFSIRTNKKVLNITNIIITLILISTLRFKAIGAAMAVFLLSLYVERTQKKLSLTKIAFVGVILLIFAFDQINFYFFKNDGFARKELMNASFEIAKDYFPIGTGFATFGSFYSAENYSLIYYKYNLNTVYGLSPNYHYFVADSFYPMLLGQFGYIGLFLYLICIYLLFKKIQNIDLKKNKYVYISKICALTYLIISSTSESSFTGPMAISLALIMGFDDEIK